jgi:putative phosphoesterase
VRIGIVSDIHGNAPALELALARMGQVDELLCAGDVVEDYRFSNEVVAILRDRGARQVLGNHDLGLLAPSGERARSAAWVDHDLVAHLSTIPLSLSFELDGLRVQLHHASACPPHNQYVFARSPELKRLAEVPADIVVLGHTHAQMAVQVGPVLVLNPGSAGEPRDHANGKRCSYAILDTVAGEVLFDNFLVGDRPVSEPTVVPVPQLPSASRTERGMELA